MASEKQKIEKMIKQSQSAILQGRRISSRVKRAISGHPTAHTLEAWGEELSDLVGDLEKIRGLAQSILVDLEKTSRTEQQKSEK